MTKAALPTDSLIAQALPRIDYADLFAAPRPSHVTSAAALARLCFGGSGASHRLGRALFAVRDFFARLVGLRTGRLADGAGRLADGAAPRDGHLHLPIGEVLAERTDELLWGLNDKHLDFRSSFLVRGDDVVVATVVRFNNVWGKVYFAFVKPFHRIIVRRMLRGATSARPRQLPSGT